MDVDGPDLNHVARRLAALADMGIDVSSLHGRLNEARRMLEAGDVSAAAAVAEDLTNLAERLVRGQETDAWESSTRQAAISVGSPQLHFPGQAEASAETSTGRVEKSESDGLSDLFPALPRELDPSHLVDSVLDEGSLQSNVDQLQELADRLVASAESMQGGVGELLQRDTALRDSLTSTQDSLSSGVDQLHVAATRLADSADSMQSGMDRLGDRMVEALQHSPGASTGPETDIKQLAELIGHKIDEAMQAQRQHMDEALTQQLTVLQHRLDELDIMLSEPAETGVLSGMSQLAAGVVQSPDVSEAMMGDHMATVPMAGLDDTTAAAGPANDQLATIATDLSGAEAMAASENLDGLDGLAGPGDGDAIPTVPMSVDVHNAAMEAMADDANDAIATVPMATDSIAQVAADSIAEQIEQVVAADEEALAAGQDGTQAIAAIDPTVAVEIPATVAVPASDQPMAESSASLAQEETSSADDAEDKDLTEHVEAAASETPVDADSSGQNADLAETDVKYSDDADDDWDAAEADVEEAVVSESEATASAEDDDWDAAEVDVEGAVVSESEATASAEDDDWDAAEADVEEAVESESEATASAEDDDWDAAEADAVASTDDQAGAGADDWDTADVQAGTGEATPAAAEDDYLATALLDLPVEADNTQSIDAFLLEAKADAPGEQLAASAEACDQSAAASDDAEESITVATVRSSGADAAVQDMVSDEQSSGSEPDESAVEDVQATEDAHGQLTTEETNMTDTEDEYCGGVESDDGIVMDADTVDMILQQAVNEVTGAQPPCVDDDLLPAAQAAVAEEQAAAEAKGKDESAILSAEGAAAGSVQDSSEVLAEILAEADNVNEAAAVSSEVLAAAEAVSNEDSTIDTGLAQMLSADVNVTPPSPDDSAAALQPTPAPDVMAAALRESDVDGIPAAMSVDTNMAIEPDSGSDDDLRPDPSTGIDPSALEVSHQSISTSMQGPLARQSGVSMDGMDRAQLKRVFMDMLPELLRDRQVQQHLFAIIGTEALMRPSALGEVTGLRSFLRQELERAMQEMRSAV